jgi:AraC family transcriptional regulator, positive regulator of tynA and feaB
MARQLLTIETAKISGRDRVALWSDALTTVCGPLHTDPLGATLDGTMTFGALGRLQIGHITVSRHRVDLSPELARAERHPFAKVIIQTVGVSEYEQRGERVTLTPGDGLVYDVAQPHAITSTETTEHFVVTVPRDLVAGRGIRLDRLSEQRFSARAGVGRLAANLIHSTFGELETISPACEDDLASSLFNLMFLSLPRDTGRVSEGLRYRIESYIQDQIRDPELSIDKIASALRCSKRYLHMAFAACDHSIMDHIWALRLDGCRGDLARLPDRTISEIAFAWGFSSSAHFSRAFRKRFGATPSEFRHGSHEPLANAAMREVRDADDLQLRAGRSER